MGVSRISTRTSGSLGPVKSAGSDHYHTEANAAADDIIDLQTAVGLESAPGAGSLEARARDHASRIATVEAAVTSAAAAAASAASNASTAETAATAAAAAAAAAETAATDASTTADAAAAAAASAATAASDAATTADGAAAAAAAVATDVEGLQTLTTALSTSDDDQETRLLALEGASEVGTVGFLHRLQALGYDAVFDAERVNASDIIGGRYHVLRSVTGQYSYVVDSASFAPGVQYDTDSGKATLLLEGAQYMHADQALADAFDDGAGNLIGFEWLTVFRQPTAGAAQGVLWTVGDARTKDDLGAHQVLLRDHNLASDSLRLRERTDGNSAETTLTAAGLGVQAYWGTYEPGVEHVSARINSAPVTAVALAPLSPIPHGIAIGCQPSDAGPDVYSTSDHAEGHGILLHAFRFSLPASADAAAVAQREAERAAALDWVTAYYGAAARYVAP